MGLVLIALGIAVAARAAAAVGWRTGVIPAFVFGFLACALGAWRIREYLRAPSTVGE
jgi:hypothetical protein